MAWPYDRRPCGCLFNILEGDIVEYCEVHERRLEMYKICNWCGGRSVPTQEVWGFEVCGLCIRKLGDYLGGTPRGTEPPTYVKNYPDPEGVENMLYYCRCSGCGNPGETGVTVADAIEKFIKEGGKVLGTEIFCDACQLKGGFE